MGNESLQSNASYEQRIKELEEALERERKKVSVLKENGKSHELEKDLQETSAALAQERQFALARAERERLLSQWVERINSSFDLDHVLTDSIRDLGQYLNVDRCGVVIFNEDGIVFNEFCHMLQQREYDANEIKKNPYIKELIKSHEKVNVEDAEEEDLDKFTLNCKSYFSVPVIIKEQLAGILYVQQCNKKRRWSARETEFLETIVLPLSTAIEKTRLYKHAKASTSQEELLNRLTTRIRSSLNLDEILTRTVKELGLALDVSRCVMYDAKNKVTQEYCKKDVKSITEDSNKLIYGKLLREENPTDPIIINDVFNDEHLGGFDDEEVAKLKKIGAKSVLIVPLNFQHTIHGWLSFHSLEQRQWTFDEVSFVEAVASQVVVAMTQSKMYEKLNNYQQKISRELKQAARVQTALIGGDVFDANLETSVFYKAHSNVSGDFYWVAELAPHVVGVLIGDVSGKGPAAALLTGYLLGEFNTAISNSTMCWLPDKLMNFLCRSILYQNSTSDFYATAWYGVFDLSEGKLSYCNAGHLNPYLIKKGKVSLLDENEDQGIPLGLLDPKDLEENYQARTLDLDPGDKMILFTDGVLDQQMPNGKFVPKDWIEKELASNHASSVKEITIALNNKLNELSGDSAMNDDRLMVCLEQTEFKLADFKANNAADSDKLIKEIITEAVFKGLCEERAVDLKLGLIEALANAVRYGLKDDSNDCVKVGYRITEGAFKMTIRDPGPGFNWQMYSHVSIDKVNPDEEGGRGLPLLKEIFDKVIWNPEGNQIGLFFYW